VTNTNHELTDTPAGISNKLSEEKQCYRIAVEAL